MPSASSPELWVALWASGTTLRGASLLNNSAAAARCQTATAPLRQNIARAIENHRTMYLISVPIICGYAARKPIWLLVRTGSAIVEIAGDDRDEAMPIVFHFMQPAVAVRRLGCRRDDLKRDAARDLRRRRLWGARRSSTGGVGKMWLAGGRLPSPLGSV